MWRLNVFDYDLDIIIKDKIWRIDCLLVINIKKFVFIKKIIIILK